MESRILTTFAKDPLMLRALVGTQLEDNILQAGCLRSGPVDATDLLPRRDIRGIEHKVAHLSPKYGSRRPVQLRSKVRVAVNQIATVEIRTCLDNRQCVWVSRDDCVVVVEDGLRNHVRARREVDYGGRCGAGETALPATLAAAYGFVDCGRVVRDAVA